MKTILICASVHHGNTRKIAQYMAKTVGADFVDISQNATPNISGYDRVGFASGVYFQSLHRSICDYIEKAEFRPEQKIFLVVTCGVGYRDYTRGLKKTLEKKGITGVKSFQCRGYDTFGIFGKIGGIAKGHPNEKDRKKAEDFIRNLEKEQ